MSDVVYDTLPGLLDGFQPHDVALKYLESESPTRAIIKGNQGGGTKVSAYDAVLRLLGMHPVQSRCYLDKPVRFVSKCLPKNPEDEENQQYVEFKSLFPAELIRKDVTARSSQMTVRDPLGGGDRKVEFMSSKQDVDAFMSVQRSAYYQDEEIDRLKWDENQMRLLKEGGDSTICLTPVRGMDWTYDLIWKRAAKIFRSQTICDHFNFPRVERGTIDSGIEVFCWATDDNPVMKADTIDRIFRDIDDPDELAMRRYGVFRQVSGRIYKAFDNNLHAISWDKYWDVQAFSEMWHFRVLDYHPAKPWYVSFVAVSPTHEWFVWNEMKAVHDNRTTHEIRDDIKSESIVDEDCELNRGTIIDPLAKVKQPNTGLSVFEDLSTGEFGLRRCTAADTKNTQGRMNIRMRLKNSLKCGVPGNNVNKDGREDPRYGHRLPTLWFFDSCRGHREHFNSWRFVDWKQEHVKAVRDVKRESEKWSDYCRNLEFLGALNPVWYPMVKPKFDYKPMFRGGR